MAQHAFHMRLKPGAGQDYVRLHSPVPQAISDQLARAGLYDYSIFLDGDDVFGVVRYDDPERVRRELADDVAPEWTKAVIALTERREVDTELNLLAGLRRVFRFDGTFDEAGEHGQKETA